MSNTSVAQVVRWVRSQVRGVPAHTLIWTIIVCSATICLLQQLTHRKKCVTMSHQSESEPDRPSEQRVRSEQQTEKEEEVEDSEFEEEEGEKDTGDEEEEDKKR